LHAGEQYSFAFIGSPPPAVPAQLRERIERDYGILSGRSIKRVEPQARGDG
jgi:hypothetical protein